MDELYDDLENYDDVDTAKELKTENAELKHILEEHSKSIEILHKDLDNLKAEFKILQTNYSSLLKSSRAEIQRKTEMITNLNIEKDKLIIAAVQNAPPNKIQNILKNVQSEVKRKKKWKRNIAEGPKGSNELIRSECERPLSSDVSHYSTATDNSNKMADHERVVDTKTSVKVTQENEVLKREAFPDQRGDGKRSPVAVDRRVSALARHQFSKLSSDEEFEDMYSALKPTSLREPERSLRVPERNRKRGRDESEDSKTFYNNTHDRPSNYPDTYRDFSRNRTRRLSSNDRNKQYNDIDRNICRDKQYDSNKSDRYDSQCPRYSPERYRRGAKEHADDRYTQHYDRSRRLVSPPRERNRYRSRERRRSCHDREREDLKDCNRYNYPETHTVQQLIHGEYDEPQNKRPRIERPYPIRQEERRLSDKQYSKEMYASNLLEHTCQSPDFSHEESSSEPVPEIRSTASVVLEDPRVTSKKYIKSMEGNKEVLQAVNAYSIYLQPVNKSLWNLQEVEIPKALKIRPSEISEEHVDEIDTDKPMSVISMESGELGSTTDTVTDDVYSFQEVNKRYCKLGSCKTISQKIEQTHPKEKSPVESMGKDSGYKIDTIQKNHVEKSVIENTSNDIGYRRDISEKNRKDRSPIYIGHKNDVSKKQPKTKHIFEKYPQEKSPIENTSKDIGNNGDILEKHKDRSPTDVGHKNYGLEKQQKSSKNEKHHNEKSPIENTSKDIGCKNDRLEKHQEKSPVDIEHKGILEKQPKPRFKLMKSEKRTNPKAKEHIKPHKNINNVATNTHNDTTQKQSILQRLINSVLDKSPERDTSVKSSKSNEGKERKDTTESKKLDITEEKIVEQKDLEKPEKESLVPESEKESKSSVQVFREFEHRVYSTRHIVEGDLELSDESNDETQLKIDEKKIEVKVKQKLRRKSTRDTSKEKPVNLEDTTRKTRSKKDKEEEKSTSKFSELFGDSSSLITPEDLNLATKVAHAVPAECCPPAIDDAQDGILESLENGQTLTSNISETKENSDGSVIEEDKRKAKFSRESKNRTHKRHKNSESVPVSDKTYKALDKQESNEVKVIAVESSKTPPGTEVKLVSTNDKLTLMQNAKALTDTNKSGALKSNEKPKGSVKSNKRLKNKDEKRLSVSEPVEESDTNLTYNQVNSNKVLASDNKENTNRNDNSDANVSSETAKIFENALASDVSKVNNEKPSQDSVKDTISSTVVQHVPNLAPVVDEPGLVKTVVISTGIQLVGSNSMQDSGAFNALASSTPAKELSIVSNSSEVEPKISHSAHVSVTIERNYTVTQSENDVPDIRINYIRRRRKVLKR